MLTKLPQKFSIDPIVDQVNNLSFEKRLDLNRPTGKFFNDPWETLSEFQNTPIGEVLNTVGSIGQARLLKLESAESYTAHADPDDRIHLAIVTNPYSFLVDITDNHLHHLPADGQLWYMDTGKIHVAANWGATTRIHLNIRVLLPKLDRSKEVLQIKVLSGGFDWKQASYLPIMKLVNKDVKSGNITGFESSNEKELFLNINDKSEIIKMLENIKQHGIDIITNTL